MTDYKLAYAKTHLASLMSEAIGGDEVIIVRDDQPLVRLVPLEIDSGTHARIPGDLAGKLTLPDDFFRPLSSDESAATEPTTMTAPRTGTSRRSFLMTAGTLAAGSLAACEARSPKPESAAQPARTSGFDRALLDAVSECVLPEELGLKGKRAATAAFVAWADMYDPVAEEMHGYGYADIRYLPPDPAPAWRAQLTGLDILARRSRGKSFAELDTTARRELLAVVLRRERGDRLPAPLAASHIAVALLSHWASSAAAHDLAVGRAVTPLTCRTLNNVIMQPVSLPTSRT